MAKMINQRNNMTLTDAEEILKNAQDAFSVAKDAYNVSY